MLYYLLIICYYIFLDGVWEFITSQEAVDIVQKNLCNGSHEACQMLIEEAAARWREFEGDYRDDVSNYYYISRMYIYLL